MYDEYARWLSNGAAVVYHGPPFDNELGMMYADFTVTPNHEVILMAFNQYDWEPFVIPVGVDGGGTLTGSLPMPWWGNGGDVMRLTMQVRSTDAMGVLTARVDAHDDYEAFMYGGKDAEKNVAYRVGPADKICGVLPGSWAGVALHGHVSEYEVWLKFAAATGGRVKIEARSRDSGGTYDFNPDHAIVPSPEGSFEWWTGVGPIYKNLGAIKAISCNSSGRVDGVHVKGVTFPDFGFEGNI